MKTTRDRVCGVLLKIYAESRQKVALDLRLGDRTACSVGFGDLGTTQSDRLIDLHPGFNLVSFLLPVDRLAVGTYFISLDLALPWIDYLDRAENCLFLELSRSPIEIGGSILA